MSSKAIEMGTRERASRSWASLLLRGSIVACLLLLFVAHQQVVDLPLTATSPLIPLARLFDLLLLGALLMLAHAAGARILRALSLAVAVVEGATFSTALGLGIMSYTALALGFLGFYRPPVLLLGLALTAAILRRDLAASGTALRVSWSRLWRMARDLPAGTPTLTILLVGVSILTILAALTPPHNWDPLTYHLAAPQHFLLSGHIALLPDIEFASLPLTIEVLYGIGLAFGSPASAQLLHVAFAGLVGAGTWALTRRWFDRPTAWLSLAVFLGTPLVAMWARLADIDLGLACFVLLMIAAALRAHPTAQGLSSQQAHRWLGLAGVFAGLALGSKYQALGAVAPLGLAVFVDSWRCAGNSGRWRTALANASIFGFVALLVASPWYLKNWLLLGNPIWPLIAGGEGFSLRKLDLMNYFGRGMALSPRTLLGYLALPLRVYTRGDFEQPLTTLSPLYVLLPALVILPRRRELAYLLLVTGCFTAGWSLSFQELRYLLPICAPLSIAAAYVLRAAWQRPRLRPLVVPALGLSSLLTLAVVGFYVIGFDQPLGVSLGYQSTDSYLRQQRAYGPAYQATRFLVGQLQPGERAIFFSEARLYYWPATGTVETDHFNTRMIEFVETYPRPTEALAALREAGISYLLVNEDNMGWWGRFDPEGRLLQARMTFDQLVPFLDMVYQDATPDRSAHVVIYRVPPVTGNEREGAWLH